MYDYKKATNLDQLYLSSKIHKSLTNARGRLVISHIILDENKLTTDLSIKLTDRHQT